MLPHTSPFSQRTPSNPTSLSRGESDPFVMTPIRRQLSSPLGDEIDTPKATTASSRSDPRHGALVKRPVSSANRYTIFAICINEVSEGFENFRRPKRFRHAHRGWAA